MSDVTKVSEGTYKPGYETVAEKIAQFILTTSLQPGDRLPTEQHFAGMLGVSRSMVREAMKLLAARGQVHTRRGSGAHVGSGRFPIAATTVNLSMPVDLEHIPSLFEFRCIQEVAAATMAAEYTTPREMQAIEETLLLNKQSAAAGQREDFFRSDIAFHRNIAEAAHNPFLLEAVSTTFSLQRWVFNIMTTRELDDILLTAEQHGAIFKAIKEGRSTDAGQAMLSHIYSEMEQCQDMVRRILNEHVRHPLVKTRGL